LGDGFFPARGAAAELVQLARDVAAEHGRDPHALEITTGIGEDLFSLRSLAELGVARVLVPVAPMPGMGLHLGRPEDAQTVMKELLDAAP
jgi:2-methylisocitrate lyase-like PEP mutase family enzyme